MIGIIDYGMGNLFSVSNALAYLKADYVISNDIQVLDTCDKLILPGVGAFDDCMKQLVSSKLDNYIKDRVKNNTPILGICLGMQALFESSEENGYHIGLGLLKGNIVKIKDPLLRVPHMGWNDLVSDDPILNNEHVYYVHSYYATNFNNEDLVAYSNYGSVLIPGFFKHKHIYATQFHPEKSGKTGMYILKEFIRG